MAKYSELQLFAAMTLRGAKTCLPGWVAYSSYKDIEAKGLHQRCAKQSRTRQSAWVLNRFTSSLPISSTYTSALAGAQLKQQSGEANVATSCTSAPLPNWRFNADKNAPHFCRLTWALTLSNLPPLLALVRVNLDNSVTISNASGRPHGKTQGGQTGFDDARR